MRKNNPAVYGCPKGKGGLHTWRLTDSGAECLSCGTKLNKEDAADCFFDTECEPTTEPPQYVEPWKRTFP